MPKARAAARRALELDPNRFAVHATLGLVRMWFAWDWAGAEAAFRRAIERSPNSAAAHTNLGSYLMARGRQRQAVAEVEPTRQLEPLRADPRFPALLRRIGLES